MSVGMRNLERHTNVGYPYIFRRAVPAGEQGVAKIELTGHGVVSRCAITFAAGENGTLHIRPYVMLCGDIPQDLLRYAGDRYISGDDVKFDIDCYQEIENHAMLCVWYHNTGESPSELLVDVMVQYDDYLTTRNIIG